MKLFVLTGASRGLGRAMAAQLLAADTLLLTIERTPDTGLAHEAEHAGARLTQWAHDLADCATLATRFEAWLHSQRDAQFAEATLINNAGVIGVIGPIDTAPVDDFARVLRVGLEAPLALTSAFLRATADWKAQRRVLNISSGAGRNPIAGWAAYCAAKAGLDHFSRVTALDEERKSNGARIVALAPGVIETAMQVQVRSADAAGFPNRQHFLDLHAKGQLATPEEGARRVLAWLTRPDFGSKPVADVRDA